MNPSRHFKWETFVLRLWQDQAHAAWRAQIVHLATRESAYFASLAQAQAFLDRFAIGLEQAEPPASDDPPIESGRLDSENT